MVQLLQSTTRLLECPWLQQQHKGSVEACIRTLAMVGECAGALASPKPLLLPLAVGTPALLINTLSLSSPISCSQVVVSKFFLASASSWQLREAVFSPGSVPQRRMLADILQLVFYGYLQMGSGRSRPVDC